MRSKAFAAAALIASIVALPSTGAAQASADEVTFTVPVNLTRLSPSISTVAVTCTLANAIKGTPLTGRVELPVSGGQVVREVTVIVAAGSSDYKPGNTVAYECALTGLSTESGARGGGWSAFDGKAGPAFTVSPTPKLLAGTLTW